MRFTRSTIAMLLASTLIGASGVFILFTLVEDINGSRTAVRVSCQLLANAIIQTGASNMRSQPSPQQRLSAFYISVIEDRMTGAQRAHERALRELIASVGGSGQLTIPDCTQVSAHPGSVRAIRVGRP